MKVATGESAFPASYAQRRLWFIQQLFPASAAYNMVVSTPLPPDTELVVLQAAFDTVAERHEALRTRFSMHDNEVIQHIGSQIQIVVETHQCRVQQERDAVISEAAAQPFLLSEAPLVRARLLHMPQGQQSWLTLVVHHIIADAQTLQILLTDILSVLSAHSRGQIAVLPEAPIEYADYAVWQRKLLTGAKLTSLQDYWRRRLEGLPELVLLHDYARPLAGSSRGGVTRFQIEAPVAAHLRVLAASERTSLFTVLLSAFTAFLGRLTGQSDLPVGLPVSWRNGRVLERV
jgi:hypothetical protein